MKKENIRAAQKAHGVFHKILLSFCVIWMISNLGIEQIPNVQVAPIYLDAIKTTDPLDFLDEDGLQDYVTL